MPEKIILKQLGSDMPICPVCGNGNAMLHNSVEHRSIMGCKSYKDIHECRDCGFMVLESNALVELVRESTQKKCPRCLLTLPESWKGRCFTCEERKRKESEVPDA